MVIFLPIVARFFFTLNQPPPPDGTVRVGGVSKHEKTLNRKVRKKCAEFAKD